MFETKLKKGFTLIELLVVVSIIALLVSILLPALGKAREQAKAVLCLSNVRQMSLGLRYYAESNEDRNMVYSHGAGEYWFTEIAPLLGEKLFQYDTEARDNMMDINICPSTQKRTDAEMDDDSQTFSEYCGNVKKTWQFYDWNVQGSYGMNLWLTTDGPGSGDTYYDIPPLDASRTNIWNKYSAVKSDTPEFGDSCWVGSWPDNDDLVPHDITGLGYNSQGFSHTDRHFMGMFCLARHGLAINVSFHDGHAEKVELERLWTLKWHKNSVPNHNIIIPDLP